MMKSAIAALIASAVTACDEPWIWEDCSWSWFRKPCIGEFSATFCDCDGKYDYDSCGWIYWDDWDNLEYEVTCNEFWSWEVCQ